MPATFTIQLHRLRFFATHGVFAEEEKTGNEFEVNLSLTVPAPEEGAVTIQNTINYADVYQLVNAHFCRREALLESIAVSIAGSLKEAFPLLQSVSVQIAKLHPPIAAFTGSVSVTYNKTFAH